MTIAAVSHLLADAIGKRVPACTEPTAARCSTTSPGPSTTVAAPLSSSLRTRAFNARSTDANGAGDLWGTAIALGATATSSMHTIAPRAVATADIARRDDAIGRLAPRRPGRAGGQ